MGKIVVKLHFEMDNEQHFDAFCDVVAALHKHLPYARAILDPKRAKSEGVQEGAQSQNDGIGKVLEK